MRELGARYLEVRGRIVDLARDVAEAGPVPVPACPGWSVHGLLSHLTGNCADVMRGNIEGAATDPWTAAQVEERKDRPTADVLAEWDELAPSYAEMIDDFPGGFGPMALSDITVHEHDLRGALGRPGERDSDAVKFATRFVITHVFHPGLVAAGLGPLELRADGSSWLVGTSDPPTADPPEWREVVLQGVEVPNGLSAAATVAAEPFELYRALTGRRSAAQIRAFDWSVDPDPYVQAFGSGPFTVRDTDLDE